MPEFHILQWVVGLVLMGLFVWVGVGLVVDSLPWKLIDTSQPGKKKMAVVLLLVLGGAGYLAVRELLQYVWRGLRYLLGMDFENL